jgi:hypothetical protein
MNHWVKQHHPMDEHRTRTHVNTRLCYLILFIIAIVCGGTLPATAQFAVDDARGLVGKEVRVPLRYSDPRDSLDSISVSGRLHLGNATVFFPERFTDTTGTTLANWELKRLSDSTYDIRFTVAVTPPASGSSGDTIAFLAGEALAGFDSICVVTLSDLSINGDTAADASGRIVTVSIGTPLPYVRFATLERNYPNPIRSGEKTTWAYRIDKPSKIVFRFYNLIGEQRITADLGDQPAGIHTFSLTPTIETATGMYIVRMETSTGDAFQFMHVVR